MTSAEMKSLVSELAPVCKAQGIRRVRIVTAGIGEIEMEFGATGEVNEQLIQRFTKAFEKGFPTDEEILFHSSPGFIPAEPEQPMPVVKTARQRRAER